jgi:hypothetical protein
MTNLAVLCALVFGVAFTSVGCAAATDEVLDWNPGNFVLADKQGTGWKGVSGNETFRLIYVKQGQTPEEWTEKAEVTELPIAITQGGRVHWNPDSVLSSEQATAQKKGCSTDRWTTLQQDSTSILYEWREISCQGYLHQHEIGRIVMGKWYLWMLSYGIKDKELSADERAEMIHALLTAKVAGS